MIANHMMKKKNVFVYGEKHACEWMFCYYVDKYAINESV